MEAADWTEGAGMHGRADIDTLHLLPEALHQGSSSRSLCADAEASEEPRSAQPGDGAPREICRSPTLSAGLFLGFSLLLASAVAAATFFRWPSLSTRLRAEVIPRRDNLDSSGSKPHPSIGPVPDAFCFTLMGKPGEENPLLKKQFELGAGLFGCAAYGIFCNVVEWPCTSPLKINTNNVIGGQWHTALNTGTFKAVWAQVLSDGVWRDYAWTIKVDPDAVFMPWRLIPHLTGGKVFFRNCAVGLHGAMEVLSREALQALGNPKPGMGMTNPACSPPQEDLFLQKCLPANGVTQVHDYDLLQEKACHHRLNYQFTCSDWNFVTFHAFKDVDSWLNCWNAAITAFPPPTTITTTTTYTTFVRAHTYYTDLNVIGRWCEDGVLTDSYSNLTQQHCEAECDAFTSCHMILYGFDNRSNSFRCATFTSCERHHLYEDGRPRLYAKPVSDPSSARERPSTSQLPHSTTQALALNPLVPS